MNGANTADIVAITRAAIDCFGPVPTLSPRSSSRATTSYTSATCGPITTWNCPPLSTTVMTPGRPATRSLNPSGVFRNTSRSRVTQREAVSTLSRPTNARMAFASLG